MDRAWREDRRTDQQTRVELGSKAVGNLAKHGVSFDEASTVSAIQVAGPIADVLHSAVHSDHGEAIRIIGARPATREMKYESKE